MEEEPAAPAPVTAEAAQVVDCLHATLIKAMRGGAEIGYGGRYALIAPVVEAAFDTLTMVRIATGRGHWKKLDAEQRQKLRDAFTEMTVAAYAGQFNDYSGQYFETLGTAPDKRQRVIVKTRLIRANGETVAFNYLMRKKEGRWVILDIHLDGTFSELAVRRSEFSSVLRDKGFDGLIAAIENSIAKYREG